MPPPELPPAPSMPPVWLQVLINLLIIAGIVLLVRRLRSLCSA